jgi:Transposase
VIADLTAVGAGTGPARLLAVVDGRSKQVFKTWRAGRPRVWRDRTEAVAMDGFTGFKTATAEAPDAVAVMGPFPRGARSRRRSGPGPTSVPRVPRRYFGLEGGRQIPGLLFCTREAGGERPGQKARVAQLIPDFRCTSRYSWCASSTSLRFLRKNARENSRVSGFAPRKSNFVPRKPSRGGHEHCLRACRRSTSNRLILGAPAAFRCDFPPKTSPKTAQFVISHLESPLKSPRDPGIAPAHA